MDDLASDHAIDRLCRRHLPVALELRELLHGEPVEVGHRAQQTFLPEPPHELLAKKYGFKLEPAWLENAQKASVRFNNGGSGGFVSPDGLIVTNHHIGAGSIQKVSPKSKDYLRDGFFAATRRQELKCPDLELNVLQEILDVTAQLIDPGHIVGRTFRRVHPLHCLIEHNADLLDHALIDF